MMAAAGSRHRILILGSSGQIARALRHQLDKKAYEVIAAGRGSSESFTLDLTDLSSIEPKVKAASPHLIINAAAYTDVERAEDEPDAADLLNHRAVHALAAAAHNLRVPLIHYSTDYVYAGLGNLPQTENAPLAPRCVYAKTKLLGELAIRKIHPLHLILRTSWIYEPNGKNFPNTILRLAQTKSLLKIVHDQFGAPTSASAVAEATVKALPKVLTSGFAGWGTYNLATHGACSWYEFANYFVQKARDHGFQLTLGELVPIQAKEYPTKALRPFNSRLSLAKFESTFSIQMPDWRTAFDAVAADVFLAAGLGRPIDQRLTREST